MGLIVGNPNSILLYLGKTSGPPSAPFKISHTSYFMQMHRLAQLLQKHCTPAPTVNPNIFKIYKLKAWEVMFKESLVFLAVQLWRPSARLPWASLVDNFVQILKSISKHQRAFALRQNSQEDRNELEFYLQDTLSRKPGHKTNEIKQWNTCFIGMQEHSLWNGTWVFPRNDGVSSI